MTDIRIGDRVQLDDGRSGVVRAIWGGEYAAVDAGVRDWIDVPLKGLRSIDAEARAAAAEARARQREAALTRLRALLESDFHGIQPRFEQEFGEQLDPEDLDAEKARFIQSWALAQGNLRVPDPEQARAIGCVNGNIQVVARAGSGKTTTLVTRAAFLMKRCGVEPGQMLLLAFNRKAAREIRRSLLTALVPESKKQLKAALARESPSSADRRAPRADLEAAAVEAVLEQYKGRLPHAMTFHALAHAIAHPEGRLLFDGADGDDPGLSRAVQEVIDEFLRSPKTHGRVRSLMTRHFREDWEHIIDGGFHLSKKDQVALRRSLPREALGGEFVKSSGEKAVADWLFEHGVAYKYERNHWWNGVNYKPDFTVFETERSGVVIEYFGLAGDPHYDEQIEAKRSYWETKAGWTLVELYPGDFDDGLRPDVGKWLAELLRNRGIACDRLSEEEIWERVRGRAIDRFSRAMAAFIGRCRKKAWDAEEAGRRIASHASINEAEGEFIELGLSVYSAYLDRLEQTGDEDFDGLMQKAVDQVRSGVDTFANRWGVGDVKALKYVFIDEFQDFSESFHRIVDALRSRNPSLSFFCVGDDWQAINGFAGAELRFFEDFDAYFGPSDRRYISTNYRSAKAIVKVGNALMQGKGKPGRAHSDRLGGVWKVDFGKFKPSLVETRRHPGDVISPLTARLVHKFVSDGKPVVLLARRNALPWYVRAAGDRPSNSLDAFLRGIRSMIPEEHRDLVSISTAHKFKGLEKRAVIVLDAVARSYPLVHPDWCFYRVFGDDPEKITEDERRLFYVALTRAIDDLVIVVDGANTSPFVEQIVVRQGIEELPWDDFPPVPSTEDPKLLLKVVGARGRESDTGTFGIKDLLSASRFQYDGTEKQWERVIRVRSFSLDYVQVEPWARAATGVDASFHSERGDVIASYSIDKGAWSCTFDAWHLLG